MTTDATDVRGLSGSEAATRLRQSGYNELPSKDRRTVLRIMLEVVREPMFLLLLAAGSVYLALGDRDDALMLLGFVFVSMAITIFQERKTERVLEALRDLSSPRALVIRDGDQIRIPGREVVVGDLLVLEEGDRIAADGELRESHDLLVDESLLTGESFPVEKKAGGNEGKGESGRVFSGSIVTQGGGLARVTAIGAATEIGRIGRALQELETAKSPLQSEIGILVKRFAWIGVAVSGLVFILFGASRQDWFGGLLAGITLAMSMLPEEFTVVLTVFMALGAWRLSRSQVLTRRTPVIETLGAATVLCVDKTGTLTQNRMSVREVIAAGRNWEIAEPAVRPSGAPEPALEDVLEYAVLASESLPFDPMEKAFHRCAAELLPHERVRHDGWEFVHEYPLSSECMAMTHVWRSPGGGNTVATKGAPEAVARLCRLGESESALVLEQVQELASRGMRVLAVARAVHEGQAWPAGPDGFRFEWLGLVGLADPLRPSVPGAVQACRQAGVQVVMITGDYPATAQAIARQAGLPHERIMSGAQLDALSDTELLQAVREHHVYARILPQQKLRLVSAFRANGQVVAMTGDGVNDAPALKAAHIGISMGQRGTDVAREASSLVLLNDDFGSIVEAIRVGRRIYDNLRKAMIYIVAVHLPIAGMSLLPLLFGAPLVLAPVHIVFLEMVINPACSIVFEAEHAERDIMRRPPRRPQERLLDRRTMGLALLYGVGLLAAAAAVYFGAMARGADAAQVRAATFGCLVLGNLSLIVASRSAGHSLLELIRIPNAAQWGVLAGAAFALAAAVYVPALRGMFHFAVPGAATAATSVFAAVAALTWFEVVKRLYRKSAGRA
ncbi:cation-translocating P-type ATPase [Noviherbaspirillum sp. UKPF54]|uniref:cation-translocating P-type ATPase n=1 Tax=Noviherbaspirillum sp. UKPF54 TaxID=2601898 RepID=UPI0011B132F9|nr:cation-translocating P-type ATPase [Noviherbaspirillum sp. UKPF54]QDZ27965.1 cation-translocating P-type ATPase [Noviherbaspirillum sp. UKPF54]